MNNVLKLSRFVKPYWKKSLIALFLLVAVVVMDLTIPRLVERIVDQGIIPHNTSLVVQTTVLMLVISAIDTVFAIGNNNLSVQVGESVGRDLREALFTTIQRFSYANMDRLSTGELLVRLSSDASVFQRLVQISLRIGTRAPLLMIGSILFMFQTDRRLAITMLPVLFITSFVVAFFVIKMGPLFLTVQQKLDRLNSILQENISGVRVVKAFARAEFESQRFEAANEVFTAHNVRVMQFMSTMTPTLTIFLNLGIVGVIWFGGLQAIGGQVTTGQLVAFVNYLQTTMGAMTIMVMLANVWAAAIASGERIRQVLDSTPEVQDAPDAIELPIAEGYRILFEGVTFRYDGSNSDGLEPNRAVLKDIHLEIEPGQTVAILGATGSGKTTLINLIPRFYDPTEGCICINGIDVRRIRQDSLLAHIAIVPQESVLFSGTVKDNIRYGRPEASDEEVIAAARAAQALDFIQQFPQQFDTHIEERGVNLSGGQKQRIAIARALVMHPSILILDDSTSSVDVETEARLQEAVEEWMRGATIIMVAQRISTVLNADKIVVLDQGRIVAQGRHEELLQSSPIYQEIYESQLGNSRWLMESNQHEVVYERIKGRGESEGMRG